MHKPNLNKTYNNFVTNLQVVQQTENYTIIVIFLLQEWPNEKVKTRCLVKSKRFLPEVTLIPGIKLWLIHFNWEDEYREWFQHLISFAAQRYEIDVSEAFSEENIDTFLSYWGKFPFSLFIDKVKKNVLFPFNSKQMEPFNLEDWQLMELFVRLENESANEFKHITSDVECINVWASEKIPDKWDWDQ